MSWGLKSYGTYNNSSKILELILCVQQINRIYLRTYLNGFAMKSKLSNLLSINSEWAKNPTMPTFLINTKKLLQQIKKKDMSFNFRSECSLINRVTVYTLQKRFLWVVI